MNPKSKALLLPLAWRDTFYRLSDKEAAALIRAAFSVALGEEVPTMPRAAYAFLPQVEEFIKNTAQHYSDVCEKRKAAINARWERERAQNRNEKDVDTKNTNVSNVDTSDSNSKYKSKSKYNNTPLTPQGGKREAQEIKTDWLKRCIGGYYRRRKSTAWSRKEAAALAETVKRPDVLAECREIMRFYRGGYPYARRDIITLLNNWGGELDRARKYPGSPTPSRSVAADQKPPVYTPNQRGKGGIKYD